MAYQIYTFPYSCPAFTTQWPQTPYTISGGTIVSIGFQNEGGAQEFWVSQMFVVNQTQAYLQVVNQSPSSTSYNVVIVVDIGDSATDITASKPDMDSAPVAQKPR